MIHNSQKGFAAILAVTLITVIGLIFSSGFLFTVLRNTEIFNAEKYSIASYYAAEAGIEDAVYRIKNGFLYPASYTLSTGNAQTQVTISGVGNQKTIVSVGDGSSHFRTLESKVTLNTTASAFIYGVQVGAGGIEMQNNSKIIGNVFSNGPIIGDGSTTITGDAFTGGIFWYDPAWAYRKKITINNSQVAGSVNLTNFPVLINLTDANLADIANGGHVGKSNGGDILFTTSNTVSKLNHEIESYVNTSGELVAWVNIPSLSYNIDTVIYIYYGNTSAIDQENPSGVWDSTYAGVWHMAEDPSISTDGDCGGGNKEICDSTVYNQDGNAQNISGGPVLANVDVFGYAIASLGDLNGDGINDIAVGAIGDDTNGSDRGAIHILFMNTDGTVSSTVKIASGTSGGPTLVNRDTFGSSIASLGDLNGDGINDIAVGAIGDDTNGLNRGATHILFMNTDGTVSSTVKIASGTSGGPTLANIDAFGSSIASLGDLNGDGINDIAVGAIRDDTNGTDRGATYILFMNTDGTVSSTVKIASGTSGGPTLVNRDAFGSSIASLGDLNGDGINDIAVGAIRDDTNGSDRGATYILFMNTDGTVSSTVKIASGTSGGPTLVDDDLFGYAIASLGDLNGDGINDIAVGAIGDDTNGSSRGATHILFMNTDGTVSSTVKIASGTSGGPTLVDADVFGYAIASLGDLNGDGINDIAVGATGDDTNGSSRGATHILFMNTDGTVSSTLGIVSNIFSSNNSIVGQIGKGIKLDSDGEYFTIPHVNGNSLDITGGTITLEAWVSVASANNEDAPFIHKPHAINAERYMLGVDSAPGNKINTRITTTSAHSRHDDSSIPDDTWTYVAMVYDDNLLSSVAKTVYKNGTLVATHSVSGSNIATTNTDVMFGRRLDNRQYLGSLDELRVSNIARSLGYITTTFNNHSSPNTFYSFGTEEIYASGAFGVPIQGMVIDGSANSYFISNSIIGVNATSSGKIDTVNIGQHAYGNIIKDSEILGDAYYQTSSGTYVGGTRYPGTPPPPALPASSMPISEAQLDAWEADASAGGIITSPCPYKPPNGTILGPVKIACDMEISGTNIITMAGTIWVEGDFEIENSAQLKLDASYGANSGIIIADNPVDRLNSGKVSTENTSQILGSGNPASYIMVISRNNSAQMGGSITAIDVKNSATAPIFYAPHGAINIQNTANLKEATGYKLLLKNSATITYESGIVNANFSSGPGGAFVITQWKEVE